MAINQSSSVVVVDSSNLQMSPLSGALAAPTPSITPALLAFLPDNAHQVSPHDLISQDRLKAAKTRLALIKAGIDAPDDDLARAMLAACRELDHFEFTEYEGKYRTMLENMQRRGFTASDPAIANAANHFAYQAVLAAGVRRIEDDERARALALVASLPSLESLNKYLGNIEARLQDIAIYDSAIKALQRKMFPGVELTSMTAQEKISFDELPNWELDVRLMFSLWPTSFSMSTSRSWPPTLRSGECASLH